MNGVSVPKCIAPDPVDEDAGKALEGVSISMCIPTALSVACNDQEGLKD